MKFTRELSARFVIRSVSKSAIRVNDDEHLQSIVLSPEELLGSWPDKPVGDLAAADFDVVFGAKPELVLLGTGETNVFPPRELTFAFARKHIGLEVMDTAAAARTFNVLANEGRKVVAILCL